VGDLLLPHGHEQRCDGTGEHARPGVVLGQSELGRQAGADQPFGLIERASQHASQVWVGPDCPHLQAAQLGVATTGVDAALHEAGQPLDDVVLLAVDPLTEGGCALLLAEEDRVLGGVSHVHRPRCHVGARCDLIDRRVVVALLEGELGGQVVIKMFGLGLAGAVLLDAAVVRMVLVPALVLAIGKLNWALPSWLDRVLPHLNVEGSVAEPVAPAPHDHQPSRHPPLVAQPAEA
jgi:hypothetical protein